MPSQLNFNPLRALDANGDPIPGALATFFETGTSTPITVYTDSGLGTPHASPLVADAEGVFAPVFTDGATAVKVQMTTAGLVQVNGYPIDPVQLISSTGSAASAVAFAPVTGNSATNVQAAIENLTTLWNAVTTFGRDFAASVDAAAGRTELGLGTAAVVDVIDEDSFATDSATRPPSQQSTKAYVDTEVASASQIKAWVNFNGTGTVAIRSSFNVSSITDNGTGDYTINFTNPMSDTNYAVIATHQSSTTGGAASQGSIAPTVLATGSVRISVNNSASAAFVDAVGVHVAILSA